MLNQSLHRASAGTPNRRQLHLPAECVLRWQSIRVEDARSTDLDPTTMHTRDAFSGPAGRLHVAAAFLPTGLLVDSPGATLHRSSVPRRVTRTKLLCVELDRRRHVDAGIGRTMNVEFELRGSAGVVPSANSQLSLHSLWCMSKVPRLLLLSSFLLPSSSFVLKELSGLEILLPSFVLVTHAGFPPVPGLRNPTPATGHHPLLPQPSRASHSWQSQQNLHHSSLGVDTIHHVLNPLGTAIASFFWCLGTQSYPLLSWTSQWLCHHHHQTLHLLDLAPAPAPSESTVRQIAPHRVPHRPRHNKIPSSLTRFLKMSTFLPVSTVCTLTASRLGIL